MSAQAKIYKLEGTSRFAARRLHGLLSMAFRNAAENGMIFPPPGLEEKTCKILTAKAPGLVRDLGLDSPSLQVHVTPDSYPRSYKKYPEVYPLQNGDDLDYYMICPIDYKGRHFSPAEGTALTSAQKQHVLHGLFKGGWDTPLPLLSRPVRGMALPRDYRLSTAFNSGVLATEADIDAPPRQLFKVGGRTQAIIDEYRSTMKAHNQGQTDLTAAVRRVLPAAHREKFTYPCTARIRHDESRQRYLELAVSGDLKRSGALEKSDAFTITDQKDHLYFVSPNPKTEAGRTLKTALDNVPSMPKLDRYWQLSHPQSTQEPELLRGHDGDYLLYTLEKGAAPTSYAPADCTPYDMRAFHWHRANERDREIGIKPPPLPKEMRGKL